MHQNVNKFDMKNVQNILIRESKFINALFATLALPKQFNKDDDHVEVGDGPKKKPILLKEKTSRALTVTELKSRFDKLKENRSTSVKNRLKKKKDKLKKRQKQDPKNKPSKAEKPTHEATTNVPKVKEEATAGKPVFNVDEKMLFSKIAFSEEQRKKGETNPKKLLKKMKFANEKVEQLVAAGETGKATVIREKNVWRSALARSQGDKVKDNPVMLKKSIKKLEQRKRSSKKKWDTRIEGVEKTKSERQQKRTDNIEKRKKDKKLKNMKKAAKKGRIIPGL